MSIEEICILNIEKGIRLIQSGKKSPKEARLGVMFKRLKELNVGMYDDLIKRYKVAVETYNNRNS